MFVGRWSIIGMSDSLVLATISHNVPGVGLVLASDLSSELTFDEHLCMSVARHKYIKHRVRR